MVGGADPKNPIIPLDPVNAASENTRIVRRTFEL